VDHALGDPLVVEVRHLLAEVEVFEQSRAAHAGLERILVVGDGEALVGGELLALVDAVALEVDVLGGGLGGLAILPGGHDGPVG